MRTEMIGARTDLLALLDLLDETWVVGDLGCGAGHLATRSRPAWPRDRRRRDQARCLRPRKTRLEPHANVELRTGTIEALPIDDATLDAAVLFLVAHFITDPAKSCAKFAACSSRAGDCSSST